MTAGNKIVKIWNKYILVYFQSNVSENQKCQRYILQL